MRIACNLIFISLSPLALLTYAIPIDFQDVPKYIKIRDRAAYSVVAVDGSSESISSTSTVPQTQIVVQTVDDTKTVTVSPSASSGPTKTIVSTKLIVGSAIQNTVVLPSKTAEISMNEVTHLPKTSSLVLSPESPKATSPATLYSVVNPAETALTSTYIHTSTDSHHSKTIKQITTEKRHAVMTTITITSSHSAQSQLCSNATSTYELQTPPASQSYDNGLWHTSYPYPNMISSTTSSQIISLSTELPTKVIIP